MALATRRASLTKGRLLTTLIAVFALLAQPMYGLIASQVANAISSNIHTTSLPGGWRFENKSGGHHELVAGGLHTWTTGGPTDGSNRKVAGYYNVTPFDLIEANDANIEFASATGPLPSLQLGVDRDSNGSWDGYLVYEPTVYGNGNFWIDKPGFGVAPGMGYQSFGTIEEFDAANPSAKVISIGYSLGTLGAHEDGDAIISKITAGGTDYTFGLPPVYAPTATISAPVQGGVAATTVRGNTLAVSGTFKDDKAVNYLQLELVRAGNLVPPVYTMHYSNPGLNSNGSFVVDMPVPANLESGNYSLFYTGTDFDGGVTQRYERTFVIDNTNPETTLVAPTGLVGRTFAVDGIAKDNHNLSRVYVQLVNRQNSQRYGGTTIHLSGTEQSWTRTFDAVDLNLPDGQYAAHVAVVDSVGNTASVGWSSNFTVDKTAPSAPVLTATGMTTGDYTSSSSVSLNWTKPDDTVKFEYLYWNDIEGNQWKESKPWTTTVTGQSRTGDFTEGEGVHYMQVVAIDAAGNRSEPSNVSTVTYDKTAPATEITNASIVGDSLTFAGIVNDINLNYYYCYLTTNQIVTVGGTTYTPGQEVGMRNADCVTKWAGGQTSFSGDLGSFDITDLADGSYTINLVAHDKAGNNNASNPTEHTFSLVRVVEPVEEPTDPEEPVDETPAGPGTQAPSVSPEDDGESAPVAPQIFSNPIFALGGQNALGNQDQSNQNNTPNTNNDNSEVLGEQDQEEEGTPLADTGEVLGIMDSKLFGLAWYWYLVILAALVGGWLLIAAAIRRNREDEA